MKKSLFKRISSFVLASAVAASAMATAFAATITIKPGEHTQPGGNDRFYAYQIFTGNIGGTAGDYSDTHEHDFDNVFEAAAGLLDNAEDAADFAQAVKAAVEAGAANEASPEAKDLAAYVKSLFEKYNNPNSSAETKTGYDAWAADYAEESGANKTRADEALKKAYKADWDNRHTMEDIKWGSDVVDVGALLEDLADPDVDWGNDDIADAFAAIKTAYEKDNSDDMAARRVAKLLAGNFRFTDLVASSNKDPIPETAITTEFLQKFATVVYKSISTSATGTNATWNETARNWTIDLGDNTGYYLIADKKGTDANDAKAPYFLDVFKGEDATIEIKSDAPHLEKTIETVAGNDATVADDDKSATAAIGDTISYKLTGYLPENFGEFYNAYYYRFTDTMDKALTLDKNSIKITIEGLGDTLTVYENGAITDDFNTDNLDNKNFLVSANKNGDDTVLNVIFADLYGALETKLGETAFNAVSDWTKVTVVVEYNAVLNSNAVVGSANKNTADLTYTNDPNSDYDPDDKDGDGEPDDPFDPEDPDPDDPDDTTTTTIVETDVFTFAIDLDKDNVNGDALAGAGFTVSDTTKGTAVFVAGAADGEYIFVGWTKKATVAEDADLLANAKIATGNPNLTAASLLTVVTTNTAGELSIKGLNTDAFYKFHEKNPPETYDPVDDFTVTLVAEVEWTEYTRESTEEEWDNGTAKTGSRRQYDQVFGDANGDTVKVSETYKYTGKLFEDISAGNSGTQVDDVDGVVIAENGINAPTAGHVTIGVIDPFETNNLPGTGGSGVYLYYIIGGALVLLAGAALFFTRKKSDKKS